MFFQRVFLESERQEGDQLCWDGLSAQISIFYNLHYGTVGIETDVFLSTPCQSEEYPLSNGPEGVLPSLLDFTSPRATLRNTRRSICIRSDHQNIQNSVLRR